MIKMKETVPTNSINNDKISNVLQEMVTYVISSSSFDLVKSKLDYVVNSYPQISKYHLGCQIMSLTANNNNSVTMAANRSNSSDGNTNTNNRDLRERVAYLKILSWICGNSSSSSTSSSPFASILRNEAEITIESQDPLLLDTQDYDFLQSLMLVLPKEGQILEEERPAYWLSPVIPLSTKEQVREARYWQLPKKAVTSTQPAASTAPLHFLEPHFVRPSPLVTQNLCYSNEIEATSPLQTTTSDTNTKTTTTTTTTSTTTTTPAITSINEELGSALQDVMRSEFIWLNPEYPLLQFQSFQMDEEDEVAATVAAAAAVGEVVVPTYLDSTIIELFETKTYLSPLLPHEEHAVVKAIRGIITNNNTIFFDKSQFVQECKLEPQTLPMLVENNHNIAIECLLQILLPPNNDTTNTNNDTFGVAQENDFLSALVSMDMSLQSMEVVNFLATTPILQSPSKKKASSETTTTTTTSMMNINEHLDKKSKGGNKHVQVVTTSAATTSSTESYSNRYLLPKEFLHSFISNCISSCENIQVEKNQKRSVRLCCIFFQNLIQHKIVDVVEVQVEIQAFCIEFSRFREAIVLFKLLKDTELSKIND